MDLVFYFSYNFEDYPSDLTEQLVQSWEQSSWQQCFSGMALISAGLDATKDSYLPGEEGSSKSASSGEITSLQLERWSYL